MKVIIAGSRNINNYDIVLNAISDSNFDITEVVCGMASGVDDLGYKYALYNKIHPEEFPRPVFLRREYYYRVLKNLEEEKEFKPENTIVIGDVYELDLALPQHLGYKVVLLETEFTPEYEKRFLRRTKNSYVAKDFDELKDIIENKNS